MILSYHARTTRANGRRYSPRYPELQGPRLGLTHVTLAQLTGRIDGELHAHADHDLPVPARMPPTTRWRP